MGRSDRTPTHRPSSPKWRESFVSGLGLKFARTKFSSEITSGKSEKNNTDAHAHAYGVSFNDADSRVVPRKEIKRLNWMN